MSGAFIIGTIAIIGTGVKVRDSIELSWLGRVQASLIFAWNPGEHRGRKRIRKG